MKFRTRRTLRTMVAALALSGTLIGGSVALANTGTGTIKVYKTSAALGSAVEKSNATGSDASITLNTAIYHHDVISVNIRNKYDNLANSETVSFSDTAVGATKKIPYQDGKGKKGNDFRPMFSYRPTGTGDYTTISYKFTP